jgi:hypothetical protein
VDVLENFLSNFLPAMGAGFANAGHGPGSFGRGFGAAATEPYQQALQRYQLQQQANEAQARIAQQNAQTGLTQAQASFLPTQQQAQLAAMTAQPRFDPTTRQYLGNMTDKQFENYVKGQGAATQSALSKQAVAQLNSGKVAKYLPSPDGRYVALDAQGNIMHVVDGTVDPAMLQKYTNTQQLVPDGSGGYLVIPKTTTGGVVPPAGSALSQVQSKVPALGANMTPQQQVQAKVPALGAAQGSPRHIVTQAVGVGFDPTANNGKGEYVQETAAEAQAAGHQMFQKLSPKQSEDNRQLNNRLADVATKITRYEDAVSQPISDYERKQIAGMLGDDKWQLGAHGMGMGFSIPVDRFNEMWKAHQINELSPAAQNLVLTYYNARESMVGYQRVLTGGSKSNEKALQMNLDALPSPAMPPNYVKAGIGQFIENIGVAGQGLPRVRGITSASDILAARRGNQ